MSFQAWLKHAWFQHCLVLFLKETHTRDRASKWRHVPKFQFRCYSECCIFFKTKKEIHLFLSFSFRSGEILYLIPHGLYNIYIYTPVFVHHFPFISRSFLCCKLQHTIRRRKNWIPLAALIVSNGPCNWAQILGHCLGETTSNRGRVSCFFVCMNSGNLFFARVLSFIEEDLEIETRTNNKPSEMVSEQLLQKNSWNTETSFALFFLWADVFPITGTGWELSSWPPKCPKTVWSRSNLTVIVFGFPLGGVPDSTRSRWRFLIKRLRPNPSNVDRDFVR